jgi:hypothetical protein
MISFLSFNCGQIFHKYEEDFDEYIQSEEKQCNILNCVEEVDVIYDT